MGMCAVMGGRVSPENEDSSHPFNVSEDDNTDEWTAVDDYRGTPFITEATRSTAAAEGTTKDVPPNTGVSLKPSPSSQPSQSVPMSRIGLNDNKAGMEGLDKAKINRIILEASKGSKFYENELKKERQVNKRVNCMLKTLASITPAQKTAALSAADKELETLERTRDDSHIIVHIDMDAFYASVEIRDDPKLKDIPMAVGGTAMLSTSNYVARRYGVRAAMPGFIAKKLCPNLVIVPLHVSKYQAASELVRDVLVEYDPHFCPVGLDESYLDLTRFVRLRLGQQQGAQQHVSVAEKGGSLSLLHWRCAEEVVNEMRSKIQERTGLTASAGLAPNMMLAKVASDMNKPNGQYTVTPTREGVLEFIQKLPIRKISGIGKVTECMLNALNVTTCGELYQQRAVLRLLFTQTTATHFLRVSIGLGSTQVQREYDRKSMSTERTFAEINSVSDLQQKCRELCHELAHDMKQEQITGSTVTLKMKTVGFEVKTRAATLSQPVSSAEQLYTAASELLTAEIKTCLPNPLRLRLMGVRISSLHKGERGECGGISKQETLDVFVQPPSSSTQTPTLSNTAPTEGTCTTGSSRVIIRCPVCGRELEAIGDRYINAHIDECLTISTIKSTTTSIDSTHPKSTIDLPNITQSTTSSRQLRDIGEEQERRVSSEKKTGSRKRQSEATCESKEDNLENKQIKRRKTLEYFWK